MFTATAMFSAALVVVLLAGSTGSRQTTLAPVRTPLVSPPSKFPFAPSAAASDTPAGAGGEHHGDAG
jgi:hypothetical protein